MNFVSQSDYYKEILQHINTMLIEYDATSDIATPINFDDLSFDIIPENGQLKSLNICSLIYCDDLVKVKSVFNNIKNHLPLRASFKIRLKTIENNMYHWYNFGAVELSFPKYLISFENINDAITRKISNESLIALNSKLQNALESQSTLLDLLRESIYDRFFDYDCENDTLEYSVTNNKTGTNYSSFIKDYLKDGLAHNTIHPEDRDSFNQSFRKALKGPERGFYKYRAKLYDSKYRWYRMHYISLADRNDKVYKIIGRLDDINDEVEYHIQAQTDYLTGLYNRSACERSIKKMIDDKKSGTMIILDTDNFKSINDTYGHDIGDLALKKLAKGLKHQFKDTTMLGRLGGDEFVIWIPYLTKETHDIINKIDCLNYYLKKESDNQGFPCISVSAGAVCSNECLAFDDMYHRADIALYKAKALGKNSCIIYSEELENG